MDREFTIAGASIPVFASVPSKLNAQQVESWNYIASRLKGHGLEPRTVGVSDPAMLNPLHEVRTLARHCAGGIILGYSQITASVVSVPEWDKAEGAAPKIRIGRIRPYAAATPWNQLETGILFGLALPLFVLREEGVTGGIFDAGSSDVLVHSMPMPTARTGADSDKADWAPQTKESFEGALHRWYAMVHHAYYR